ncbi:MAG: FRG domain-containing protein [Methylococcales bacterium]
MTKDIPHVHHCETVTEFLAYLSPQNGDWGDEPNSWIFRGQADSNWSLVPKILRLIPNGKEEWDDQSKTARIRRQVLDTIEPHYLKGNLRLSIEWALVDEFLRAADLAGLHIPEDTQLRRNLTLVHQEMLRMGPGRGSWPPASWLSSVALAQHYGIPTRLLDWSWKPKVAMYFACLEVASGHLKSEEIAVWALHSPVLLLGTSLLQYHERPVLVTAPYEGNPNLAAQSGVFTVDYDATNSSRPFERFLQEHLSLAFGKAEWTAEYLKNWNIAWCPFRKVVISSRHANELLRRLAEEHISAATIFPGYRGIYESLVEQRYWDQRPWDEYNRALMDSLARDADSTSAI